MHNKLKKLKGEFSRSNCEVEPEGIYGSIEGEDIDNGLEYVMKKLEFPEEIKDLYLSLPNSFQCQHSSDPPMKHPAFFTALAAFSAKYTPDEGDVWISNYKKAGDCDSISIAAVQTCYSLCKNWMVGIALGYGYLHGEKGRELKAHAYPVYVSRNTKSPEIFIDEPTYTKQLYDTSPGTGHLEECKYILFPGGAVEVGKKNDTWDETEYLSKDTTKRQAVVDKLKEIHGKDWKKSIHAPMDSKNTVLEKAIYKKIADAWDEIKENYPVNDTISTVKDKSNAHNPKKVQLPTKKIEIVSWDKSNPPKLKESEFSSVTQGFY